MEWRLPEECLSPVWEISRVGRNWTEQPPVVHLIAYNPGNRTVNRRAAGWIFVSTLILLITIAAGYLFLQRANYNSALDATKKWARLNDFPASATTHALTQAICLRERLRSNLMPRSPILKPWLNESPGTNSITPTRNGKCSCIRN